MAGDWWWYYIGIDCCGLIRTDTPTKKSDFCTCNFISVLLSLNDQSHDINFPNSPFVKVNQILQGVYSEKCDSDIQLLVLLLYIFCFIFLMNKIGEVNVTPQHFFSYLFIKYICLISVYPWKGFEWILKRLKKLLIHRERHLRTPSTKQFLMLR